MPAGPLTLYDSALLGLFKHTVPQLEMPITAVLLSAIYTPDRSAHSEFSDVSSFEITGYSYARKPLTGQYVSLTEGILSFGSDAVHFGDPVTFGPTAYLALVYGYPASLTADSALLGCIHLGAAEAQNSRFVVSPPAAGWFTLTP